MKGYLRSSFRKYGVILCFLDPICSLYKFQWKSQSQTEVEKQLKKWDKNLRIQILVLASDTSQGKDFLEVQFILGFWNESTEKIIKYIKVSSQ